MEEHVEAVASSPTVRSRVRVVSCTVNGKAHELEPDETVARLLERLGLEGRYALVELNGEALERDRYAATELVERRCRRRGAAGGRRLAFSDARRLPPLSRHRRETRPDRLPGGGGRGWRRCRSDPREVTGRSSSCSRRWPRPAPSRAASGVPFVVNDRPDLAVIVEADYVHVGQDDLPVEAVRAARSARGPLDARSGRDRRRERRLHRRRPRVRHPDEGGTAGGRARARPVRRTPCACAVVRDRRNRRVERGRRRRRPARRRIAVVRAIGDAADPAGAARALRRALDRVPRARGGRDEACSAARRRCRRARGAGAVAVSVVLARPAGRASSSRRARCFPISTRRPVRAPGPHRRRSTGSGTCRLSFVVGRREHRCRRALDPWRRAPRSAAR